MGNKQATQEQVVQVSKGHKQVENPVLEVYSSIKLDKPLLSRFIPLSKDLDTLWSKLHEKHSSRVSCICQKQESIFKKVKETERQVKKNITPGMMGSIAILQSGKQSVQVEEDFRSLSSSVDTLKQEVLLLTQKLQNIENSLE
mmetsp:Transcript_8910/g.13289  ORF Transcript_8910/g.13289 Transcript_8910/m.13289 type:complete len:143 (+) Transcript_8910:35-463(+)